jgi:penicillin-binding protein 2
MQILDNKNYEDKSKENSIRRIEQIPLRGVFYDRNMKLLVSNNPAYTLRITPSEYDKKLNSLLEAALGVEEGYINKILYNNRTYSKYIPIRIKRGIDFKAVAWLEENIDHLPGVDYIVEMQRSYLEGVVGAHLFGYSKEIGPKQLEAEKDYYSPGDYVGNTGIEKFYEKELRGKKGYKCVLVDSRRKEIGPFKNGTEDINSIKGRDLVLSIDANVQKAAEDALRGREGAAVAIEPKTGEILAFVSSPEYDLNQFSYVTPRDYMQELMSNPKKPLFNRAVQSLNPPGSTFKVMAAMAALEEGIIDTNTTIFCGGGFSYGRFYKCHGSHGSINVIHAIEHSCNTFFYQLIFRIGLNRWADYARKFGFGRKTGVDIGQEQNGLVPDENYYVKRYGKNWPKGAQVSLGIGQGELNVSPIQLAQYTALIANNGKTFTPHIVKGYVDDKTKKMVPYKFKEVNVPLSPNVYAAAKRGMYLVVNGSGTGTALKIPDVKFAGKTGTAQNPHGKDHALFIAFAPYDDPKIAVAVIVENVGFGATYAGPIAKRMIETYLSADFKKKMEENKTPDLDLELGGGSSAD